MEDVRNGSVDDIESSRLTEWREGDGVNGNNPDRDGASRGPGANRGDEAGLPEPGVGASPCRIRHDWGGPEPLGTTVVDAVSRATGQSMIEVERLSTVVDPDALESVFRPLGNDSAEDARVIFPLAGRRVTVYASGDVIVESG